MSDSRLSELERRWKQSGVDEDAQAYLAELGRRLEGDPKPGRVRVRLGRALLDLGRFEEARSELEQAKTCGEGAPEVRAEAAHLLGQYWIGQRSFRAALRELGLAREGLPKRSELWKESTYLIARIYEAAGKQERAVAEYATISDQDRQDRDVGQEGQQSRDRDEGQEGSGPAGAAAPLRPTDPPRVPPSPSAAQARPHPSDDE